MVSFLRANAEQCRLTDCASKYLCTLAANLIAVFIEFYPLHTDKEIPVVTVYRMQGKEQNEYDYYACNHYQLSYNSSMLVQCLVNGMNI